MGKSKGSIFDTIAPIALSFIPGVGPLGAAAYSGVKGTIETGNPLQGLKAAGLSYLGNQIGAGIGDTFGGSLGTVGAKLGTTAGELSGNIASSGFGNLIGAGASNAIGSAIANKGIGSMLGGFAGNSLVGDLMPQAKEQGPAPFQPRPAPQDEAPGSLSGLSMLSPEQQSSNIANKGVYGGGNGPDEQSYFTNLINRRLLDSSGKMSGIESLSPIESSYLGQIGLGGYNDSGDLLKAMSTWRPS